jgi:Tol biopolymer transport system component
MFLATPQKKDGRMRKPKNIARLFSLTLTLAGLMSWNTLPIHSSGRAVCAATRASLTRRTEGSASAAVANGKIAFVSDRDGNAEIYTMNPDGSDLKRLTFDPGADSSPAWSPDGLRIVFGRSNFHEGQGRFDGRGEIHVMNADGSNQTRLTTSRNDNFPAWSPDGTKIAFSQDLFSSHSHSGIYVMNADGSDQRIVNAGYEPSWSPDGLKLAFMDDSARYIYSSNADGSSLTQITLTPFANVFDLDFAPAWSPDGASIAFTRFLSCDFGDVCRGAQIWVVNADGSGGRPLTQSFPTGGLTFTAPSWSSDGAKIVFSLFIPVSLPIPARYDLFVMNSDGSGLTNITNTADTNEWDPSWRPLSLTGCADSISPTSQSFEADGGTGSVEVTADSECSWAASSNASWISVTSGSSPGNGSVSYSVAANTGTGSRTAGLIVAGHIVSVTQSGVPVRIISASVEGKRLFVVGENFDPGAVILLNDQEQKTWNDSQNPQTALIGKKAGKKIKSGDKLQVRNPNETISQEFTFTGS